MACTVFRIVGVLNHLGLVVETMHDHDLLRDGTKAHELRASVRASKCGDRAQTYRSENLFARAPTRYGQVANQRRQIERALGKWRLELRTRAAAKNQSTWRCITWNDLSI